jgi:hypothetical protein
MAGGPELIRALIALLLLFPATAHAEESSVKFHERATLVIETPTGDATVVAVGSSEIFKDKIKDARDAGTLVVSGLFAKNYTPPMIFELLPDRFLVCTNCTGITARTFGITDGADFDRIKALVKAAPRDTARPAYPDFRPTFSIITAPKDFDLVANPRRPDLDRVFGPGVKIKSFMVEVTDAPVTENAALEKMPWLCAQIVQLRDRRTNGNSAGEIAVRRTLRHLEIIALGDCG